MTMRILAITPTHPDYGIRAQTATSIQAALMAYDGPVDWMVSSGDNPHPLAFENVTHQHNRARRFALDNGYDALLSIEADMVVPADTISRLIDCDADIAYGLYVFRQKLKRWSAYNTLTLWGGESVSLNHNGSGARAAWGKIVDVAGLGMGCTLICRKVLERFEFRLHDGRHSWIQEEYAADFKTLGLDPYQELKGMVSDDYLLALDAQHYGLSQRANLGLVCGHIVDGGVMWPDPDADKFYRVDSIDEPAGSRVRS